MKSLFVLENVSFAYSGHNPSLCDVSFNIDAGERVILLGANGSGKSTLLHLLDGLYFAAAGSVSAFGQILTEKSLESTSFSRRFRQEVGFLFQNSEAQLFCASVEEELAFGPLQIKLPPDDIDRRIGDTLELLELTHLRNRVPQDLSSGEQKRVALASLLVMSPSVLLLDEPTSGLDPRSQSRLIEILEELHRGGLTLITATHDLALLPHLADRSLILGEDHRLLADVPADQVLSETDLLVAANLIHTHRHRHGDLVHDHPHPSETWHDHSHE